VLGGLARLWSAWGPPGLPWSWSGGRSRRIARAGTRPECRDHGRAGDRGGSRGRAPARTAGIMVGRVITEDRWRAV